MDVMKAVIALLFVPIAALSQVGAGWSPKGSMPYERAEMASAALNGKIYLISGGSRGVEANAFNQEFDPSTGAWRELALMPSVASHAGAAALNGKIYVVGGFVANVHVGAVNRVFEYDPATDRWRALAPLAAPPRRTRRGCTEREDTRHRWARPGASDADNSRSVRPCDQHLEHGGAAPIGA